AWVQTSPAKESKVIAPDARKKLTPRYCITPSAVTDFISNSRKEHDHRARLGPVGRAGNRLCGLPLEDVVRGVKSCVNPATPWVSPRLIRLRQLEIERLPIGIQDHVKEQPFLGDFRGECNAVRTLAPVRLAKFHTVPGEVRPPEALAQAHALALGLSVSV